MLRLDFGDRRSRGVPNREIQREGPAQRLRERGQAVVHPNRAPRRDGGTLGHVANRESRRVVPRDPVGEFPLGHARPLRRGRPGPRPREPDAILANEPDGLPGRAAAFEGERRLRIDAVGPALQEHAAARPHVGAADQRHRPRQAARLGGRTEARGAAVGSHVVRVVHRLWLRGLRGGRARSPAPLPRRSEPTSAHGRPASQ